MRFYRRFTIRQAFQSAHRTGVALNSNQQFPRGSHRRVLPLGYLDGYYGLAYVERGVLRVFIGCRHFTIDKARAYWRRKPGRAQVRAALTYANTMRAIAKREGRSGF